MKNLLKIIFIVIVILGLVASYTFLGTSPLGDNQQASTGNAFEGPDSAPFTNGPNGLPPSF